MSDFDEADNMCPNCVTPWKCNGPHLDEQTPYAIRLRAEDLPDVWKALEDDEAFVAALFRGIADIEAGRTVTLRFEPCWNCHGMTSFWVDEDGTPRDVISIEVETFCARIEKRIEALISYQLENKGAVAPEIFEIRGIIREELSDG